MPTSCRLTAITPAVTPGDASPRGALPHGAGIAAALKLPACEQAEFGSLTPMTVPLADMMIGVTDGSRVYIGEAAERVNRRVDTLRKLDSQGVLPRELRPRRDNGKRRYWLEEQMAGLEQWFSGRVPGSALSGYNPDSERVALHLERMRQPRSRS